MERRLFLKTLAASIPALYLACRSEGAGPEAEKTTPPAGGKSESIRLFSAEKKGYVSIEKVVKSEEEWKKILTPGQFNILRNQGTEYAFSGEYWNNHEKGIYICAGCKTDLFDSETKFESGTGWPSFWQPIAPENVAATTDKSHLMMRTEVHCARCSGHLGHVFDDGPKPTGLRYCINSASLQFQKAK